MPDTATAWEKTKTGGKKGFDTVWRWADKLGAPVNRFSNKLGSEAFWPTTLDKESDKAARILRSFCKDGFYEEEVRQTPEGPKQKQKVLKKIPVEVIKNAKGLAIFTTMRTGLWISGAGGSGVLLARLPDGSWSPPSGILLHTAGLGFLVGIDIYDCVIVINTEKALEAFTKVRVTLGGEISVAAGPVGVGGVMDTEVHKRQSPIWTYMKSRGFYAGVQVDGTIVIERSDENERFYLQKLPVADILSGKVRHPPYELKMLMETLKSAQGDTDIDESVLPEGPPPADMEVVKSDHMFGIPDKEDPDPYGVRALEAEGLEIREAGTGSRVSVEEFEFRPSPTSPVVARMSQGFENGAPWSPKSRQSWRSSVMSDRATQTDGEPLPSSPTSQPPSVVINSPEADHDTPYHGENGDESGHEFDHGEVHEVHDVVPAQAQAAVSMTAAPSMVATRAKLVTIPKRIPPALPPRSPRRTGPLVINAEPSPTYPSDSEQIKMEDKGNSTSSPAEGLGVEHDNADINGFSTPMEEPSHEKELTDGFQDVSLEGPNEPEHKEEETKEDPEEVKSHAEASSSYSVDDKDAEETEAGEEKEGGKENEETSVRSASFEKEEPKPAEDFHSLPPSPEDERKHFP